MDNKHTTRQLRESLDYAENIISTVREPLIVLDGNLRIISTNQSFYRTFLTTPDKTEGKLIYEVANGQWDIPKLRELLENVLPKNTSFENYVVEHEFSELGRRVMLLNARCIHGGGSKTQKILLAIEDITERTQMEHEKASSELRYRRLFETAQDGILILGAANGEINDVNPFLLKMLGYPRQELLGKKLWEIGFFKDTNASHKAFQTLQEKGYVRYEDLPLETKDGQPMEVEFVSNVYAIDGETVIQCNIRDITSRKKTEDQLVYLASFTELNPNPILELDAAGDLKYLNPAAKARFPDLSKLRLNHPFLEGWESFAQTLVSGKTPSITRDIKVGDYWYQQALTYAPFSKSYRLFVRDITARINAAEELRKRTAELEVSNKELEAFSYSVSHDLRAPLRSIAGFSSALIEDYTDELDDQAKEYLKHIQDSSDLMAQLIDDLLKLSRVTRSDIDYKKVNLSNMTQKVVAELATADPQRKVSVTIAPYITAYGDKNLLLIVLENLLGNAWKFSSKVAEPRIETGMVEHNNKQAFFVRDNGVGFDMAYADKLFKPFQRLHQASEFTGTGIGLATVQRIISRHRGEVWTESKVGEGATFYFTLN